MTQHPADTDLASLVEGGLSEDAARTVRKHLEHCADCMGVVVELSRAGSTSNDSVPTTKGAVELEAGTKLGRYVILGRLGAGAMGVVYAAHDPMLGRQVAVKILRELPNADSRQRLLQEARILAQLSHPNVSAVYDAGHDHGVTYLAMEFLSGTSLRAHLLAKELDWSGIVELFRQAAEGLAAAHGVGIVQRDFKPENVMVTTTGRVVVTDFGLAAAQTGSLSSVDSFPLDGDEMRATRRDRLIGTPAYMAPEQLQGQPADARSDQFSLCVSLYEALTGALPFKGNTLKELAEALESERRAPFQPRFKAPTPHAEEVLASVLERGLAKDPAQRFRSMRELLSALDKTAKPKRPRAVSIVAVTAVVVTVAASSGLWWQHQRTRCSGATEHIAQTWGTTQRQAISAAFGRSAQPFASTSLTNVLEALDAWSARWATLRTTACEETQVRNTQPENVYTAQLACLEQRRLEAAALIEVLSNADDGVVTKSVAAVSGLTPLSLCGETSVLLAPVPPPSSPAMEEAVAALGPELARVKALNEAGKFPEALKLAEPLTARVEATGYRPLVAQHQLALGVSKRALGDAPGAAEAFFACTRAATEGRDDERAAECHIGLLYTKGLLQDLPAEGHAAARTAESLLTRLGGDWHLQAMLLGNEGVLYNQEGKFDQALPLVEKAVAVLTQQLGPQHNEVARALTNLGAVYVSLHRYADAERVYASARAIFERLLGQEHPSVAVVLNNSVEVLASQKRYGDARRAAERALAIRTKLLGPTNRQTITTQLNLAGVQLLDGQLEDARKSYEVVIAQWEKDLGPTHVYLADPLTDLGTVLRKLDRPQEALMRLERALSIREGGKEGPYKLASTQLEVALALQAAKHDLPRARKLAASALEAFTAGGAGFAEDAANAKTVADSLH